MPELPEVQTIVNGLKKAIVGKAIAGVEVLDQKCWQADQTRIIGPRIIDVRRRAKTIIFDFENGHSLYIHLKMTGQLIYRRLESINDKQPTINNLAGGHPSKDWWAELPNKYTRVIFSFNDKSILYFNDLRRFGWIRDERTETLADLQASDYGVEPLSPDFTVEYLESIVQKRPKSNIKKIITEQSLIAGIGNIYADESLFYAGILPTRLGLTLKSDEIEKLHQAIIKSLDLGIKHKGASDSDYVNAEGERGEMQHHFRVYGRKGESCKLAGCRGTVEKIRLNGRGTHFCSDCQK